MGIPHTCSLAASIEHLWIIQGALPLLVWDSQIRRPRGFGRGASGQCAFIACSWFWETLGLVHLQGKVHLSKLAPLFVRPPAAWMGHEDGHLSATPRPQTLLKLSVALLVVRCAGPWMVPIPLICDQRSYPLSAPILCPLCTRLAPALHAPRTHQNRPWTEWGQPKHARIKSDR